MARAGRAGGRVVRACGACVCDAPADTRRAAAPPHPTAPPASTPHAQAAASARGVAPPARAAHAGSPTAVPQRRRPPLRRAWHPPRHPGCRQRAPCPSAGAAGR
eukprot:scaffold47398_cov63-Phaeocystis_antarctica.AAC.2